MSDELRRINDAMLDAQNKAWEALSGYKFWMFGYHAGRWVNYNRLLRDPLPNPFSDAVRLARRKCDEANGQLGLIAPENNERAEQMAMEVDA